MTTRAAEAHARRLDSPGRPQPTAILIPVLGRPHSVVRLLTSLVLATPEPHRVVFVADDDDIDEIAAIERAGQLDERVALVRVPAGTCYAAKINAGVDASTEPVLFQGADDLEFHPEWLSRAQARLGGRCHVVGTNDGYNPRVIHGKHSTHSLFTRTYVELFGTIDEPGKAMHEGYPHAYVDDEFVQTARHRRAFRSARDALVEHLHPFAGKSEEDWVYLKGRALDEAGRRVYESRRAQWTRLDFGP